MAEAGPDAMEVRLRTGVTVAVPPDIALLTPYVLLEQETWFEDELAFLCRAIGSGERVVDVGASYGLYSISLAKAVGGAGRVWAFEPASSTAAFLRASVELNGFTQVEVVQKAVSNRPGSARLTLHANSELNSMAGPPGASSEEVPVDTLDRLAKTHRWERIAFLKIDAEGEEERILEGGAAFFAAQSPLAMFEIRHGAELHMKLVDRFKPMRYDAYALVPGLDLLVPFAAGQAADAFRLNLFACKPERAARLEAEGRLVSREVGAPNAQDALAHYRAAHDASLRPAFRYAHLQAAHERLSTQGSASEVARVALEARIARELGLRERAIERLNEALRLCLGGAPLAEAGVPAPTPAFDAIPATGSLREWMQAALLDALVELSAFSTYFSIGSPLERVTLDRLEALKAAGYLRPPMERRRQLLRARAGLQSGPVADPLLAARGPDHLNPEFWGGAAA